MASIETATRRAIDGVQIDAVPGRIPIVVRPAAPGLDLNTWAAAHEADVRTLLQEYRALLFRGFSVPDADYFHSFVTTTSKGPLLEYKDRSTPRYEVGQRVYVSTVYPADQRINLHNEGTYWATWPGRIYFCCLQPSDTGGETPIADVRGVYARIDPEIRQKFVEKQVMYVRNYHRGVGLKWQDTYQTENPADVEEYGRVHGVSVEWQSDGRLVTRQKRPAVRSHPVTGEPVWFNHAAFFHSSSLDPVVREVFLTSFGEDGFPYNTYYGDGERIEDDVAEHVRQAYVAEKQMFPWQKSDVMLLDNMTVAHAREPYTGSRNVIVGMTEAHSNV